MHNRTLLQNFFLTDDLCHCARAGLSLQCNYVRHEQHFKKNRAAKQKGHQAFIRVPGAENFTYQFLFRPVTVATENKMVDRHWSSPVELFSLRWLSRYQKEPK